MAHKKRNKKKRGFSNKSQLSTPDESPQANKENLNNGNTPDPMESTMEVTSTPNELNELDANHNLTPRGSIISNPLEKLYNSGSKKNTRTPLRLRTPNMHLQVLTSSHFRSSSSSAILQDPKQMSTPIRTASKKRPFYNNANLSKSPSSVTSSAKRARSTPEVPPRNNSNIFICTPKRLFSDQISIPTARSTPEQDQNGLEKKKESTIFNKISPIPNTCEKASDYLELTIDESRNTSNTQQTSSSKHTWILNYFINPVIILGTRLKDVTIKIIFRLSDISYLIINRLAFIIRYFQKWFSRPVPTSNEKYQDLSNSSNLYREKIDKMEKMIDDLNNKLLNQSKKIDQMNWELNQLKHKENENSDVCLCNGQQRPTTAPAVLQPPVPPPPPPPPLPIHLLAGQNSGTSPALRNIKSGMRRSLANSNNNDRPTITVNDILSVKLRKPKPLVRQNSLPVQKPIAEFLSLTQLRHVGGNNTQNSIKVDNSIDSSVENHRSLLEILEDGYPLRRTRLRKKYETTIH